MRALVELYRDAFGGLPKATWLLSLAAFVNRSGTMVVPFLSLYLTKQRGMSETAAALLIACFGIGSLGGNWLGGWLSDRFGPMRTQVLSLFSAGAAFALLAGMREPWLIAMALLLLGVVLDAFRPGNLTAIAGSCTAEFQTRAFVLNRLAGNAGWAIGPALGGQLASIGYVWLFFADGLTSALAAVVLLAGARRQRGLTFARPAPPQPHPTEAPPPRASPLRDRRFLALLGWNFLATLSYMMFFQLGPLYLDQQLGYSERQIGLLLAINPVVITLCEMVLVHHLRRRAPMSVVALGSLLLALGFGLLPLSSHPAWIITTVLVWTVGEMLQAPTMGAYMSRLAPPAARGRYLGIYGSTFSAAWVLAPIVGAQIRAWHADALWYCSAAFAVMAALGFRSMARTTSSTHVEAPARKPPAHDKLRRCRRSAATRSCW